MFILFNELHLFILTIKNVQYADSKEFEKIHFKNMIKKKKNTKLMQTLNK